MDLAKEQSCSRKSVTSRRQFSIFILASKKQDQEVGFFKYLCYGRQYVYLKGVAGDTVLLLTGHND